MSAVTQFLATFLGAAIGVAIVFLFFRRSRAHLTAALCMAVAVCFTVPIYRCSLDAWRYGILLLPLLGGVLAGLGWLLGTLIERGLRRGPSK